MIIYFILYFCLFFNQKCLAFHCYVDHPDGKLIREECHLDYCYTLKCDGKTERGCTGSNFPFDCESKENICKMFHPESKLPPKCRSCKGDDCNRITIKSGRKNIKNGEKSKKEFNYLILIIELIFIKFLVNCLK